MKSVKEVCSLAGISPRTLHWYDEIGLLPPSEVSAAGYRLYDDGALVRLQDIMLLRELEFPLKEIKRILDSPDYDRNTALDRQIRMLELKKEHVEGLIAFAKELREKGEKDMSFEAFDKEKMENYAREAYSRWGGTEAYKEYEKRAEDRSSEELFAPASGLMDIFRRFGEMMRNGGKSSEAGDLVLELKGYITDNWYTCTDTVLEGLGEMYAAEGEMKNNIDAAGGEGTADFVASAIADHLLAE